MDTDDKPKTLRQMTFAEFLILVMVLSYVLTWILGNPIPVEILYTILIPYASGKAYVALRPKR